MRLFRFAVFCLVGLGLALAEGTQDSPRTKPPHALAGAWLAEDGTVFRFRENGTFVGIDFRAREIWGSWVVLDDRRIGFQSLLNQSYYRPQFAVIAAKPDEMDYSYSDRPGFIHAQRISDKDAEAIIAEEAKKNLVLPESAAKSPAGAPAP